MCIIISVVAVPLFQIPNPEKVIPSAKREVINLQA